MNKVGLRIQPVILSGGSGTRLWPTQRIILEIKYEK